MQSKERRRGRGRWVEGKMIGSKRRREEKEGRRRRGEGGGGWVDEGR